MPKRRSSRSFAARHDTGTGSRGNDTPLWSETTPPETIRHRTSPPSTASTASWIIPSSIHTGSPGRSAARNSGWLSELREAVPLTSRDVKPNGSPVTSVAWPPTKVPRRTLGPWRSCRIVTGRPHCASPARMARITSACSAWVPWEKFRRATSMPAVTSRSRASGELLAGPMVQTILVRLKSLSAAGAQKWPPHSPIGGQPWRTTVGDTPSPLWGEGRGRFQRPGEVLAGKGFVLAGDFLGGAGRDHLAALVAALGPQVHDPVRGLDHVHVVLDDHHRVALVHQLVENFQEAPDIGEVQPGGGLVEDVERAPGRPPAQLGGELHALGLAAGDGGGGLPEADVVEPHVVQRLELLLDRGHRLEERERLRHRHVQDVGDVLALVADLERLAVVALSAADLAGHVHVGQEVHLDLHEPVALAGLAAPALDVEREAPRLVAAHARVGRAGEQRADEGEDPGVGGRVRPRRPPDRRLVDVDHLVEVLRPLDAVVGAG